MASKLLLVGRVMLFLPCAAEMPFLLEWTFIFRKWLACQRLQFSHTAGAMTLLFCRKVAP